MDSRLISRPKALPNTILLKDYLLDDFSSCSSNGFKSFPRRQCCTTVRFLLQNELKKKQEKKYLNFSKNPPKPTNPPSKSALSAFQNVISAVKRLPFPTVSSPEKKKCKNSFLPRSFSRKILKKSFWKRKSSGKEIPRWTSFDQLMKDDPEPLDRSINSVSSESKSNSSSESDFTVSTDDCSSGNSPSVVQSNLPLVENDVAEAPEKVGGGNVVVVPNDDVSVGSTTSSDGGASTNSSTYTKKQQWPNEEKEQFSPVSVLDCPFDDEVSSPFQHRLVRMEGTKNKLMKKIQKFESLAQLEPVNLSKRFTSLPESDNESIGSPYPCSSASIDEKFILDIEDEQDQEEGNQVEQRALGLLDQLKDTLPSYGLKLKEDNLLLDFFREKIVDSHKQSGGGYLFNEEVLEEAERWINGRKLNLLVDWEVQKNRQAYIKDMEREWEWKTLNQETEEVALELESEVFASLLNDMLLDISPHVTI